MRVVWPLVGRAEELALPRTALGAATSGAVLSGPAGVGKTRLAAELAAAAEAQGWRVVRAAATRSMSTIAFGAVLHLLPAGEATTAAELMQGLRRELGGDRPVLCYVDDAHLLDEASAAAVHMLAATCTARVVVTLRTGEAVPDAVAALWGEHSRAEQLARGAIRLGVPGLHTRLESSSVDGPMVAVFVAHATALASCDRPGLDRAAQEFAGLGVMLLAAEAAAQAATAHDRAGDRRRQLASADANRRFASRCEGARTPVLHRATQSPALTVLTTREREIAGLAARGYAVWTTRPADYPPRTRRH